MPTRTFVALLLRAACLSILVGAWEPTFAQSAPAVAGKTPNEEAMEFSTKGVGLLLHLGEGETLAQYKPSLRELMIALKQEGIPAHISGGHVTGDRKGLYVIVRKVPWPVERDQPYSLEEIRSGAVLQAIRGVYARSRDDREFLKLLSEGLQKRVENIDAEMAMLRGRIKANEERIAELGGGR